jgi:hypothetical protein
MSGGARGAGSLVALQDRTIVTVLVHDPYALPAVLRLRPIAHIATIVATYGSI